MKDFLYKLLFGMAQAVVIALSPNAILGTALKPFVHIPSIAVFMDALVVMQGLVSFITGILVALAFKLNPMKATIIGAAAFVSSGVLKHTDNGLMLVGIGDLLNVLIFTSLSVLITLWLKDRLGSLTILIQPIIAGALVGFLGLMALPYIASVTVAIGKMILYFTQLQPLLMSILIAISFAVLIISPISTVAISLIISLSGLASGAANLGVTSTAAVLVIGSLYARNKSGVALAVFLGAMKMMIPNLFKAPIMYVALISNAIIVGVTAYSFHITGTPISAGFGLAGMIGPIEAYNQAINAGLDMPLTRVLLSYAVIPFLGAFIVHLICCKTVKGYSAKIYRFEHQ
ncbi:hypothetical protein A6A21_04035 [Phocoenobacter uteri]|nr:hypothetical protein [Phocoenobacter uteri]